MSKDNTKVQHMLTTLGRSVEELRSSEAWRRMLEVQARFHRYSASNLLMIYLQRPDATQVAGYRQWQHLGRQVRKGEKAIRIFAPMTRKDEDGERKLIGFKMVSVFDYAQTEGDPLPILEWPKAEVCPPGILDRILERAVALGITVDTDASPHPLMPGARGWYDRTTRTIHVVPDTEASMAATLLHELGHALDPQLAEDTSRQRRELVAESVSYVLGRQLGIAVADEAAHYLASWEGTIDGLLAVMERVKVAVHAFSEVPAEEVAA